MVGGTQRRLAWLKPQCGGLHGYGQTAEVCMFEATQRRSAWLGPHSGGLHGWGHTAEACSVVATLQQSTRTMLHRTVQDVLTLPACASTTARRHYYAAVHQARLRYNTTTTYKTKHTQYPKQNLIIMTYTYKSTNSQTHHTTINQHTPFHSYDKNTHTHSC